MPTYTYTYGDNPIIDYPRLIVSDTGPDWIFADQEIMAGYQIDSIAVILPVSGGLGNTITQTFGTPSYRRCAATLLDSLAANAGRLSNVLKVLDIEINVAKAASDLRAQAKALRDVEANSGAFAIAEVVNDEFSARERWVNQFLRIFAGG